MIFNISLNHIEIHAPVGVYEKEKIDGNDFIIDILIEVDIPGDVINEDDIDKVIDYADITRKSKEMMIAGSNLIETAAHRICTFLINNYPINKARVKVSKLNPPIEGVKVASASAEIELSR